MSEDKQISYQHLRDFAYHMMGRSTEPMDTATIVAAFVNIGNFIGGQNSEERRQTAREALKGDDRLKYDEATDRFTQVV